MRYTVIGVPYTSSGLTTGEALAPAMLRDAGLIEALRNAVAVTDRGEVTFHVPTTRRDAVSGIIAPQAMVSMIGAIRGAVGRALRDGEFPIVIGGECPLLLGCLAATNDIYGHSGLLFVDGHEDAWPPESSPTGEAADMELGLALGVSTSVLPELTAILPTTRPADTAVLGPRDRAEVMDAGIASIASMVTMVDDAALRAGDIAAITKSLVERLQQTVGHWWFHLDLDVLSTDALAAIRYPQPGGLDWPQLETLTRAAMTTPGLVGWNITIYNPDLDPDRRAAAEIVSFLGRMARYLP